MPKDSLPIKTLLIANRGEIAVRIIRAAKSLGIQTVAVYSLADKDSLHVQLADKAFCIGPASSLESYLNINSILSVAISQAVDAVHPGVGFLSENAEFAQKIEQEGLIFVGPSFETIAKLGDKVQAKETALSLNVPCIPGSKEALKNEKEALQLAKTIGFPVILKAASGGGGKGMRIVEQENQVKEAFKLASAEAQKAFSDPKIYLEKYLTNPSHVEVQMIADSFGNVYHLGERDCSVQQHHQKWIEEAPSPNVSEALRKSILETSLTLFRAIGYRNAGTVEYLVQDNEFYFMEVNTRIQVEHPVSEMLYGIDLIRAQIQVAQGKLLEFKQSDIKQTKHALECRITAKAPGKVEFLHFAGGFDVRIDSFLYTNYHVLPFYDALLAKIIVCAPTRKECLQKMLGVLDEIQIQGVPNNLEEQKQLLRHSIFQKGSFGTNTFQTVFPQIGKTLQKSSS